MSSVNFSLTASVFQAKYVPQEGCIVGYCALIHYFDLLMPYPYQYTLIAKKNKRYDTEEWRVFPPIYKPKETLYAQLQFAIKYEGLNLLFFKRLFEKIDPQEIVIWIENEPTSDYTRKIWYLFEFLTETKLPVKDADVKIKYITLINEKIQYANEKSLINVRHRIKDNLPGTVDFCPLIFKTQKLENYIQQNLAQQNHINIKGIRKDVLQRASAFLLLKDSKASFTIEGESPKSKRASRWGQAIGQAGAKELSIEELNRLQALVIENHRFLEMGLRRKGGFVGEHDRETGEPIPDHISAKWQDVESLISGLIKTNNNLINSDFDAVLSAAMIAFGFVFIHPFEDGNGRIHRYLIHHVLAKKNFAEQGIIFPVSAAILNRIVDYRKTLENYSLPLLDFIEWKESKNHNVEVLNDTIDFYRYFDATKQAEFLYDCVNETIEKIIPQEIHYLKQFDEFKNLLENEFDMPDSMISLLVRFLEQNDGKLSNRAKEKEFVALTESEILDIENSYQLIFKSTT
jgi:Fic family protein